jgi:hypothetical protein
MRRLLIPLVALCAAAGLAVPAALAGNPHQVQACTVSTSGNVLTVSCKEAGLGDEAQIEVSISADALCINPGGNHPKAVNKEHLSSTFAEPVQNGKADFTETLTATFQPDCTPPMTVEWQNISVIDTTNNIVLYP